MLSSRDECRGVVLREVAKQRVPEREMERDVDIHVS